MLVHLLVSPNVQHHRALHSHSKHVIHRINLIFKIIFYSTSFTRSPQTASTI